MNPLNIAYRIGRLAGHVQRFSVDLRINFEEGRADAVNGSLVPLADPIQTIKTLNQWIMKMREPQQQGDVRPTRFYPVD